MFAVLQLDPDTVAMYERRSRGSEVLLFKRTHGFLGKLRVPERGEAVVERLLRSFHQISSRDSKNAAELFVAKGLNGV
jgi:hypothetical protein